MAEFFLEKKIEYWQNQLLTLDEKIQMVHYDESTNLNLKIQSPSPVQLFDLLVAQGDTLEIQCFIDKATDYQTYAVLKLMEALTYPMQSESGIVKMDGTYEYIKETLYSLATKSNFYIEEMGIHTLYIIFGFLQWFDEEEPGQLYKAPLILVPVHLFKDVKNSNFNLALYENDIIVNPTIKYLFEKKYGFILPKFQPEIQTISQYFQTVTKLCKEKGWSVDSDMHLSLLYILDIDLYKDLELNKEIIMENPIIRSFAGLDRVMVGSVQWSNEPKQAIPQGEAYPILDTDFHQKKVLQLSKEGTSFIIQGPPGTGKTQTITNMIAQGLADGKKILFVSEKMNALETVHNQLEQMNLSEFCFFYHHKKEEAQQFFHAFYKKFPSAPSEELQEEQFDDFTDIDQEIQGIFEKRNLLEKDMEQYSQAIHTAIMPFEMTIYDVFGLLSQWDDFDCIPYAFLNIESITKSQFDFWCKLVNELELAWEKVNRPAVVRAWEKTKLSSLTEGLLQNVTEVFSNMYYAVQEFNQLRKFLLRTNLDVEFGMPMTLQNMNQYIDLFEDFLNVQQIPPHWCFKTNLDALENETKVLQRQIIKYHSLKRELSKDYEEGIFKLDAIHTTQFLENGTESLLSLLKSYESDSDIIEDLPVLCNRAEELGYTIKNLKNDISYLRNIIGYDVGDKISMIPQYYQFIDLLWTEPSITRQWFIKENIDTLEELLDEVHLQSILYFDNKTLLLEKFTTQIYELEGTIWREYLSHYDKVAKQLCEFAGKKSPKKLVPSEFEAIVNDLEDKVVSVDALWENAQKYLRKCKRYFPIPKLEHKESIKDHLAITEILLSGITPPASWTEEENRKKTKKIMEEAQVHSHYILPIIDSILERYEENVFELPYHDMLERFQSDYITTTKVLQKMYHDDKKAIKAVCKTDNKKMTDENIITLLKTLSKIDKERQWFHARETQLVELLGNYYHAENTDWQAVETAIPQFEELTTYLGSQQKVFMAFKQANAQTKDLLEHYHSILAELQDKIGCLDIINHGEPLPELLQEWKNVASIGTEFCDGLMELEKYKRQEISQELTYGEIMEHCNYLEQMQECEKWLQKHESLFHELLPLTYMEFDTNWEKVEQDIATVKKIKQFFPDQIIPKTMIDTLPYIQMDLLKEHIQLPDFKKISKWFRNEIKEFLSYDLTEGDSLEKLDDILSQISFGCIQIQNSYYTMEEKAKKQYSIDKIIDDIKKLDIMQKLHKKIMSNENENKIKYGKFYQSFDTDWAVLLQKLKLAKGFQEKIKQFDFNQSLVTYLLDIKLNKVDLSSFISKLKELDSKKEEIQWICNLFENESQIKSMSIYQFQTYILQCVNEISSLQHWIDYKLCKQACFDVRLNSIVTLLEKEKVQIGELLPSFQKTFYQQWLQWAEKKYPCLVKFEGINENGKLIQYSNLVTKPYPMVQKYIYKKVNHSLLKQLQSSTILKELDLVKNQWKEKASLPTLKEIVASIPHLLLQWKPCFMMSTLSVPALLDLSQYHFDMVIFDEASQISPQNAISSMIRGNQIIIVGDRKQLPPTDYHLIEKQNKIMEDTIPVAYPSILDEAMGSLPSEQFSYHYRSQSEDLIAFSNQEFYKNQLLTFPNCNHPKKDFGVEYCYVNGGIYENYSNKKEAQKCIELLKKQIENYPDRSLGIVVFHENQRILIEKELTKFRNRNPAFEWFFEKNKNHPFFIKKIDDVQGNERDTIFLSIGFGKNINGTMTNKFGILDSKNGNRYFNVAITRAKCNLKLIGSIFPADIGFDRIKSEGVRLLRSYMIYAIGAKKTVRKENVPEEKGIFCENVTQYISNLGYQVHKMVGCSENIIDIAIEYPDSSGIYIAGIECDGSTCSIAKNTLDREYIRKTVLSQMNWSIYRLWSADWVKNPKKEKEKLAIYLKNCVLKYERNLEFQKK